VNESRDAFIEIGARHFRVKPTTERAFSLFRASNNYSKITDALNQCIEDGLRLNGFLRENTVADVVARDNDSLGAMSLAFAHLVVRYADNLADCMRANKCNHARAIEIIFDLGAERGAANGYSPVSKQADEVERLRA